MKIIFILTVVIAVLNQIIMSIFNIKLKELIVELKKESKSLKESISTCQEKIKELENINLELTSPCAYMIGETIIDKYIILENRCLKNQNHAIDVLDMKNTHTVLVSVSSQNNSIVDKYLKCPHVGYPLFFWECRIFDKEFKKEGWVSEIFLSEQLEK